MNNLSSVPVPPMKFNLWGTVDEAKPLGDSTRSMLGTLMGVREEAGATAAKDLPVDAVTLSPVRLSETDLRAFADIVGESRMSVDDDQRAPRARGKSSLDLLEWRAGRPHVISAPDAVLAPGTDDEVLAILEFCSAEGIAVVPFGGGTSVVGGLTPTDTDGTRTFRAVVSLDLARFDELTDVDDQIP